MAATVCEPVGVLAIKLKGPLGYEDTTPLGTGAGAGAGAGGGGGAGAGGGGGAGAGGSDFGSLVSSRADRGRGACSGAKLTLAQPVKKSRVANK